MSKWMSKFQRRRERAERFGVNDKHCWASFREASDNARGWSLMGYLIFCCERGIENIRSTEHRVTQFSRAHDRLLLRQQRQSLRSVIQKIRHLERGEPSALNGLRAQISGTETP